MANILTIENLKEIARGREHELIMMNIIKSEVKLGKNDINLELKCLKCSNLFTSSKKNYLSAKNGCKNCKKTSIKISNEKRMLLSKNDPEPTPVKRFLKGYEENVLKMANEKNVTLKPFVEGKAKFISYTCNIHKEEYATIKKSFLDSTKKIKCCEYSSRSPVFMPELINMAQKRNHTILQPFPSAKRNKCTVHCNTHNQTSTPIVCVYLTKKFGTLCCGEEGSAISRITHGDTVGRQNPQWRICSNMNSWRKEVNKNESQFFCLPFEKKETHHLWSAAENESIRFNNLNGFVLGRSLHRNYHKSIGTKTPSSPQSLVDFLKDLKSFKLSPRG